MDQLLQKNGHARSALLVHKSIRYTRRKDMETETEAHVWISVSLPSRRKINIQCWFRQWQQMGIRNIILGTDTPDEVMKRFTDIAVKWNKSTQEAETITFSDTNVNLNNLDVRPSRMNPDDKKTESNHETIKRKKN